jgi:hypothetical protein
MKKNTKTDTNTGSSSQHDNALNESDSNKMRKSRRRLIQVLVTGGAVMTANSVPGKWSRPVVEAVMLPAHAQTSGLITLGNNGNFNVNNTQDMEQTESLLASGISNGWAEVIDTFIEEANAGPDDGQSLCGFAGCSYIEYISGANSGMLYLTVMDYSADSLGPRDIVMNFTDGQVGPFSDPCLDFANGFRVDLENDTLAYLTLLIGEKVILELDLVKNFVCEPVEDGAI